MQYAIYLYTGLTIFGFWLALQISKRLEIHDFQYVRAHSIHSCTDFSG